jgi:hypothetical protein
MNPITKKTNEETRGVFFACWDFLVCNGQSNWNKSCRCGRKSIQTTMQTDAQNPRVCLCSHFTLGCCAACWLLALVAEHVLLLIFIYRRQTTRSTYGLLRTVLLGLILMLISSIIIGTREAVV